MPILPSIFPSPIPIAKGVGISPSFTNSGAGLVMQPTGIGLIPFPVTSVTFSPTNISGLQLWLIANDLAYSNGAQVTEWDDHRGAGTNALTQTPGTACPTMTTNALNGLSGVTFDVFSSQFLNIGTPFNNTSISETHFAVFKIVNIAAVVFLGNTAAGTLNSAWVSAGHINVYDNSTLYQSTGTYTDTTSYHLFTYKKVPATSASARFDKVDVATTSLGANVENQSYNAFGFSNSYNYAALTLCEFLCYNSALSTTDTASVESYLNTKYALGL